MCQTKTIVQQLYSYNAAVIEPMMKLNDSAKYLIAIMTSKYEKYGS